MFLISLLPEYLIHLLALVSFIGSLVMPVIASIPFINMIGAQYRMAAQYGLLIILVATMFLEGVMHTNDIWKAKEHKQEVKDLQTEVKSEQKTTEIVEKVLIKKVYIKGDTIEIRTQIPVFVPKEADAKCDIPNSFVQLWNGAIDGKIPESSIIPDGTTSEIKLSEVAENANENFGTYREVVNQCQGLMNWVTEQRKIFNKENEQ